MKGIDAYYQTQLNRHQAAIDAADLIELHNEDNMKTYEIEFERKSYTTIYVEANTQEEAEILAWRQIEHGTNVNDAQWNISSIEERD